MASPRLICKSSDKRSFAKVAEIVCSARPGWIPAFSNVRYKDSVKSWREKLLINFAGNVVLSSKIGSLSPIRKRSITKTSSSSANCRCIISDADGDVTL